MHRIEVPIGTQHKGQPNATKPVVFKGEPIAERRDEQGGLTQVLFRSQGAGLIVHEEKRSGDVTEYQVFRCVSEDLQPGGAFEELGREANVRDRLTPEQALEQALA